MTEFGDLLRELRTQAGLSQPGLAAKCEIPVGSLRNWERGRRLPSLEMLLALARGLEVSLGAFDVLLAVKEEKKPKAKSKKRKPGDRKAK